MINPQEFSEFAASRRSVRDFLPTPIDQGTMDAILTDAMTAPSWSNTRPYLVAIASGAQRARISRELLSRNKALAAAQTGGWMAKLRLLATFKSWPISDYRIVRPYPKELAVRSGRIGKALYALLGVERGDAVGRAKQWQRNYEFFGAPTEFFIFTHSGLGEYSASDAGLFMQNLMLSAHARGLGTCAQGSVAIWARPIHREFEIPKGYKLLCGIAIGYASADPVNSFRAERLDISEIVAPSVNL